MAPHSISRMRTGLGPLILGIIAAIGGLCISPPLHAQVDAAAQVVDTSLPLRESGYGLADFGGANLRMSYDTSRYGQDNGQFGVGLQERKLVGDGAWLLDIQYTVDFGYYDAMGINAGGGFRQIQPGMFSGTPRILGATFWYDGRNSREKNYFNQFGVSLESLGERWDFRLNANVPLGTTRHDGASYGTGEIQYQGLYLSELTNIAVEQAVAVVDFEAACRVRDYNAWLFGGVYTVHAAGETKTGGKGGVRGQLASDLYLQLAVTNDDFFDTEVTFSAIWLPGRAQLQGPSTGDLHDRLRDPVLRNDYIAIRRDSTSGESLMTDADGDAIRVVHVDSSAAAGGDGSIDNPFSSLTDVYGGSQTKDIVLVHSDSTFEDQSIVLRDFQRLLGEGNDVTHSVLTSKYGAINLPESSAGASAGAVAVIDNTGTGLTAVTLADASTSHSEDTNVSANEVSNLSIIGGARAIASTASGIATVNLNQLSIADTTGHGIELTRFVETITETGDTQSRFNVTIDEITFDNIGGDDIHLDADTDYASASGSEESISISNITSTDTHGWGINVIGNWAAEESTGNKSPHTSISNVDFTAGAETDGGIRFESSSAGAYVSDVQIEGGVGTTGIGVELVDTSGDSLAPQFRFTDVTVSDMGAEGLYVHGGQTYLDFNGKITQTVNDVAAIRVEDHSGDTLPAGLLNFREATSGAGVVEATVGDGIVFDNADGYYQFSDEVALSGGATLSIVDGSDGEFIFDDTNIGASDTTAFLIDGGTANVDFTGSITQSDNAAAVTIGGGHDGSVSFSEGVTGGGVITAINGTGLQFNDADGFYTFNDAVTLSGGAVVNIANDSEGTMTFGSDTSITTTSGTAFTVADSSATVTYGGTIDSSTAGRPIELSGNTGGIITFSSGSTVTGTAEGIWIHDNTGGTFRFNGLVDLDTAADEDAVTLANNSSTNITFNDLSATTSGTGIGLNVSHAIGTSGVTIKNSVIYSTGTGAAVSVNTTAGTLNFLAEDNAFTLDAAATVLDATASGTSTLNATIKTNAFVNAGGHASVEIANADAGKIKLNMLDNTATQVNADPNLDKRYVLTKGGSTFGIALLNPAEPTDDNVNQRNQGTGAYGDYPSNWVIDLVPGIGSFNNLEESDVPTPTP